MKVACSHGCGATFSRKDNAQRHARGCAGDRQQHRCACGQTFSTAYGLKRHGQNCPSDHCRAAGALPAPLPPLVCPDCHHSWPHSRARDYQAHVNTQACRWHVLCPLCQHSLELRSTLGQEHDVCSACDRLATQLHQETRWNAVLQYPFGTPAHATVRPEMWRTTAHPEEKKKEPSAMVATPWGPQKRRRVMPWGVPTPMTQWLLTPAGDAVVKPTRAPTPEALRLLRWYSVGFDPQRAQQAPHHHRLLEPVPVIRQKQEDEQKDVVLLLQTEREALDAYAQGAFAFCAHGRVWKTLEAHLRKCPGKKGAAHLWRGRELEMCDGMVQQDADRYYWWFLSPHAACTRAALDLLPPVAQGPDPPSSERLQQWCTTMGLPGPEPLTPERVQRLSQEERRDLLGALYRLTALDEAHHTQAWRRLSPFLQLPGRCQEANHNMALVAPNQFEQQQQVAQDRQRQQLRQLRVLRVQHLQPGGKRMHKKAPYRVSLPFPSVRPAGLTRPWLVHPLLSLSGPVRVLQRRALMRQSMSGSMARDEQKQKQRALAAAEWLCASMGPKDPEAVRQRVPLWDVIQAQLMARQ